MSLTDRVSVLERRFEILKEEVLKLIDVVTELVKAMQVKE